MKGSFIAEQIDRELQRKKYFKEKKRQKCRIDKKMKCVMCMYQKICEDAEVKDERNNSIDIQM